MERAMMLMALALAEAEPPRPWASPVPCPPGTVRMTAREKYTQAIYVLSGRDEIKRVPVTDTPSKWHQSGGTEGVRGVRSDKFKYLPPGTSVKYRVATIQVHNDRNYQPNKALVRRYPVGAQFHDVLSYKGKIFEHRVRTKTADGWESGVPYRDRAARPPGYAGLQQSCASCHNKTGTGGYDAGLVPGGDTVFSDPMDWKAAGRLLR